MGCNEAAYCGPSLVGDATASGFRVFGVSELSQSPKPGAAGSFLTSDNAPRHVLVPSESMRGLYMEFISSAVFVSRGMRMHFALILITPVILKQ